MDGKQEYHSSQYQQPQYQQPQYQQGHQQQYEQQQQQQYYQQQQQYQQQPDVAYQAPQAMNEKASTQQQQPAQSRTVQQSTRSWAFGLFDCFSPLDTCCVSFWCPCYLFGKTYERNKTGDKEASGFNGMCCAYVATLYCGCAPILQCMQRGNTRDKHNIDGGVFGDFCTACCCSCCALIQEEKESVVRVTGVDPTTGAAYQPVGQMSYP